MDKDQFQPVYRQVKINPQRCVFEKAILNHCCDCKQKQWLMLTTHQAVGCRCSSSLATCTTFLNTLRGKSRFALHEIVISGPLTHHKEMKVQVGGTLALQLHLFPALAGEKLVLDIDELVNLGLAKYSNIADFPYGELIKGVVHYECRPLRVK